MSVALTTRPRETPVPWWEMSPHAREVYASLGAIAHPDPDNLYALAAIVDALTWTASQIFAAANPEPGTGETPWAAVVDPWRCPWWALRWCGQLYGLRLTPALPAFERPDPDSGIEQEWRQTIADRVEWRRGHVDMLIRAARRYMIGARRIQVRERYDSDATIDSPYHLQIRVRASDIDPAELIEDDAGYAAPRLARDVLAQVPVGLLARVVVTDDRDWDLVVETYPTWADVEADVDTWDDLVGGDD